MKQLTVYSGATRIVFDSATEVHVTYCSSGVIRATFKTNAGLPTETIHNITMASGFILQEEPKHPTIARPKFRS